MQAQNDLVRPDFTAHQIGPTGGWLWPGRMFSIYGKNLGPAQSCVRDAGPFRPDGPNTPEELAIVEQTLPLALCGVRVLMDEEPVRLIYVHEKQINFVVAGRIPLHLRYRMDRPGTYFARYVPGSGVFASRPTTTETEWTPVVVKAGSDQQRRTWLTEKRRSAPTDREALLYDFLPSIFGYGDPDALQI